MGCLLEQDTDPGSADPGSALMILKVGEEFSPGCEKFV
jgi:hypothetical protein